LLKGGLPRRLEGMGNLNVPAWGRPGFYFLAIVAGAPDFPALNG
jgi:hypothetical protein